MFTGLFILSGQLLSYSVCYSGFPENIFIIFFNNLVNFFQYGYMIENSTLFADSGLSKSELARALGIRLPTITAWKEPPVYAMVFLAQYIQIREYKRLFGMLDLEVEFVE